MYRVILAHRRKGTFWSIETVFDAVSRAMGDSVNVTKENAPGLNANLEGICANLRWCRTLQNHDVIHQTGDIHYAILSVRKCPTILTIHDIRFIEEAHGIRRFIFLWLWLRLPCYRANKITVISEYTKQRVLKFCPINTNKIKVVANCVGGGFLPNPKPWPEGRPNLLQVGTTPNKNFNRVIEACWDSDIKLSVLGILSTDQKKLLENRGMDFEEYTNLSSQQVVDLYRSVDLVIFASTYEGFGMPIIEAQATGRPVLTSNIAPMNEVAGEGALIVDPYDVQAIREGIIRLIQDSHLRDQIVKKGFENVKQYSAKAVASQYTNIYREVIEAHGS